MNNIKYLFSVLVLALLFTACKDELEPTNTPFVALENANSIIALNSGEKKVVELKLYAANIEGSDREIEVELVNSEVVSKAVAANLYSYTLPATVVIPSGSNAGVLQIAFTNVGIEGCVATEFKIKLKEKEGMFFGLNKHTIKLVKTPSPFDINNFVGTYIATGTSNSGEALESHEVTVVAGPTATTLQINNMLRPNSKTIVELNNDDPSNPYIDYKSAEYDAALFQHGLGPIYATPAETVSTFRTCDNSMDLTFKMCLGDGRCFPGANHIILTKK